MTVSNVEKQSERVCAGTNHLSPSAEEQLIEERGCSIKPDYSKELQAKVKKAIEAFDLCYNCETGFHYMKQ